VTDIMTRYADLATIGPETPLIDALKLLQERDVGQLPVIEDDGRQPIGWSRGTASCASSRRARSSGSRSTDAHARGGHPAPAGRARPTAGESGSRWPMPSGRVLVDPRVVAAVDVPAFDNSAMDGYAVRAADTPGSLRLLGEVSAGSGASCPPSSRGRPCGS
jgi:CBS domain-containing protein